MRIGLNGLYIGEKYSGVQTAGIGLVQHLACGSSTRVLYTSATAPFASCDQLEIVRTPVFLRANQGPASALARMSWSQTMLPLQLRRDRVDVFLSLLSEGMLFPSVPQVLTVHDVIPLLYPEEGSSMHFYYRHWLPHVLRRCARIIASSESTKRDLMTHYRLREDRIAVTYQGIHDAYFAADAGERPASLTADRYFLVVGNACARKNLEVVIRAYARLRDRVRERLVVIGYTSGYADRMNELAKELGIEGRMEILTGLRTAEMKHVYGRATALLHMSRYEGFGLPVAEAMAAGTPVIASRCSSLPELVGDTGLLLEPDDDTGLAEAMVTLSGDAALRDRLAHAGRTRALQRFRWPDVAQRVCAVLVQAAGAAAS